MDNELIVQGSWWKRNRKWFIPLALFIVIAAVATLAVLESITDFSKVYTDAPLYEKALEQAGKNERVHELLGDLYTANAMDILEGNTLYSDSNNEVAVTLRIRGKKGKGRMDITAVRDGIEWDYKTITVRIKEPKEEIKVVEEK